MNTEQRQITVNGLRVMIERKSIKNLHLGVYPPHGRIRVAAPLTVSDDAVRLAVIHKLHWIKRQRSRFESQSRQSARELVRGESHYFLGRRYRLCVVHGSDRSKIVLSNGQRMELSVEAKATAADRQQVLEGWYRQELKKLVPPLLAKWQPRLGVEVDDWRIKKMKTKWGACTPKAGRIWLNLELIKKPVQCLEYIVVHELAHLIERLHNERFLEIMDHHLPTWRLHRQELNAAPLAHHTWDY